MTKQLINNSQIKCTALDQYYLKIINCIPSIIYWIGRDCRLQGCNQRFVQWLGLRSTDDIIGQPYEVMNNFTRWSNEQVHSLKLDDMKVIFNKEAQYDAPLPSLPDKKGVFHDYIATRIPMFDSLNEVTGLVVVLTDVTETNKLRELAYPHPTQTVEPLASAMQDIIKTDELKPVYVLVIEDEELASQVEKYVLTTLNCSVDIAETGAKALELFAAGKYALVLMDIGLTDNNGYMLSKKFRGLEKGTTHHVPIIALTGFDARVVKADCIESMMEGVLRKPLTKVQASQLIQHYVHHQDIPVTGLQISEQERKQGH